ncbi:hypothetical protein R2C4_01555 (plasmid) [Leisingera aquaemixtae]|nr:hypothetical protein R2C4_01555 [Leisingera aquaemixtae]
MNFARIQRRLFPSLEEDARRTGPKPDVRADWEKLDLSGLSTIHADRLAGTPRKCLGWRTPAEAFRDEHIKLR